MKEEEVKRISEEANKAARTAFGKAKWLSLFKGGKRKGGPGDSDKEKKKSKLGGKDSSPGRLWAGSRKSPFKRDKPGKGGPSAEGSSAGALGKGGEDGGEGGQPGAANGGTVAPATDGRPPVGAPIGAGSSAATQGALARTSSGLGSGAAALARSSTLPPSRIRRGAEQTLTVRDLVVAMERDPYLCKSSRLLQLHLST
mmetsp:Transcript_26425/g.74365  ORF Transcript_26425/g.74365 Transcript_26425/m.74365 type:complete len:199 (+) Transcript_26425:301-897(+)